MPLVFTLIITKTLLVPLFWAILFAYLLYPAASKFEEDFKIPRIATNLILIIGSVAFVVGFIYLIAVQVVSVTAELDQIRNQFAANMRYFQYNISSWIGVSKAEQDYFLDQADAMGQMASQFFTATTNTILAVGLIPVYTFLLLFYRNKFRKYLSMLVKSHQEDTLEDITEQASNIVPKYLKGLFIVCFILVGLNTLGFYLIGVEYAFLLGLVAAFFNLIPYLGTVIGYGIVFVFVIATQSPSLGIGIVIQFFIVQFIENNILTPNITGSYVEMNPLVIILSLIAGGMVWGLPGLFMVIPYLAMLKIFCENIDSLKPIGYLLGTRGTERYSITIKSVKRRFGWHEE